MIIAVHEVYMSSLYKLATVDPEYSAIYFYKYSALRFIVVFLLCLPLFPFTIPLVLYSPRIRCSLFYSIVHSPNDATIVLLLSPNSTSWSVARIFSSTFGYKPSLAFLYRKQKYVLVRDRFLRIDPRLVDVPLSAFRHYLQKKSGLSTSDVNYRLEQDGPNTIDIQPKSLATDIFHKLFHPFYIFQIISVNIWFHNGYMHYAVVIFCLSMFSAAWEIYSARKSEKNLRAMAQVKQTIQVWRDGVLTQIDSSDLVVGDLVVLESDRSLVCDMVMVQGNCIVDESSLTGETIPVMKTALPASDPTLRYYKPEAFRSHTLFAGSVISHIRQDSAASSIPSPAIYSSTSLDHSPLSSSHQSVQSLENVHISPFRKSSPPSFSRTDSHSTYHTDDSDDVATCCNGSPATPCHTLFDSQALGVVIATGFTSTKGQLFRSILYPHEFDLRINRQTYSFLMIMIGIALAAFTFKVVSGIQNEENVFNIVFNSLDLITVAVPPSLPLVLSIGIGFSLGRLKQKNIYCINPDRINFAGWIDLVCWDKTGTLTDSKLQFQGIHTPSNHFVDLNQLDAYQPICLCLAACHNLVQVKEKTVGHFVDMEMYRVSGADMDTCSGKLHHVVTSPDDQIISEHEIPYAASISVLPEGPIHILKRYDFDSQIQRSSVLVAVPHATRKCKKRHSHVCTRRDTETYCTVFDQDKEPIDIRFMALVKGSPENIKNICNRDSIPANYDQMYHALANQGYYVIAFGYKQLTEKLVDRGFLTRAPQMIRDLSRSQVESDLVFCGFALFKSPIKPEAFKTVRTLDKAGIRSVMITGDGPLTAVYIGRQLGLVKEALLMDVGEDEKQCYFQEIPSREGKDPTKTFKYPFSEFDSFMARNEDKDYRFAMSPGAFYWILDRYDDEQVKRIMNRTAVYARARPNDKTAIVEKYMTNGQYVAMTGDGTNDSGAMKAAHIGLALSDTEASIVAPFSSGKKNISDLLILLLEGRGALDTAFTAFKFMVMYPVIQMMTSIVAYYHQSQMGNPQWLVDDLGIAFGLATLMLYTRPTNKLINRRPVNSLFSRAVIGSIVGQILINVAFSVGNLVLMLHQPWYCNSVVAKKNLDPETFLPINATYTYEQNYPCYYIDPDRDVTSFTLVSTYESTFSYLYGHFQMIGVALGFSLFNMFRRPVWTNIYFVSWLVICFSGCSFLLLLGHDHGQLFITIRDAFQFRDDGQVPQSYRFIMYLLVGINLVISIFWEYVISNVFPPPQLVAGQVVKKRTSDDQKFGRAARCSMISQDLRKHAIVDEEQVKAIEQIEKVKEMCGKPSKTTLDILPS